MDGYHAQQLQQPLHSYASASPPPRPAQVPRQGTGILKYPYGTYNTPKEHSVKTLRFEMDMPAERAPVPEQSAEPAPSATTAEGAATDRSSTSTTVTTGVGSDDETKESQAASVTASQSQSTDVAGSSVVSSSATSGPSEAESSIISSSSSSSSTISSVASTSSYSVPEDVKRFFRHHKRAESGSSSTMPTTRDTSADERREMPRRRSSWWSLLRWFSLLTIMAVLLTMLLVGVSADVYGTLIRGLKDGTPPVPVEDTVAAALSEPERPAVPDVPHRLAFGGARRFGSVTHESDINTERTEPVEVGVETEPSSDAPATSDHEILSTSTVKIDDDRGETATEPPERRQGIGGWKRERETPPAPMKSRRGMSCEAPAFTYCQSPREEFYYENTVKTCVSAVSHQVGVCIRGANKFDSKRACREACVEKRRLSEQCSRAPSFMECKSKDVLGTWWYLDGKSCRRWNFTSGLCPAHGGGGAFVSREECVAACVGRRGRSRLCRVSSRPDHCYSDQLKFPYFAVATEDDGKGPLHCFRVSTVNYHGQRCLVGDNRFPSLKACRMACMANRSDTKLHGSEAS
ncbi:hypothetical protein HPB50_027737 [Hyalomma asiaticum]|nr:hypothetical protein HPB50_027737 [Hyalomma asiaticum]